MSKSAMIRARIEPELKNQVDMIFEQLGLTTTEAIKLFYSLVLLNKGLPFQVRIPNEKTIQAFQDTDEGNNLTKCKDVKDMFDKLEI
ncbi:MAG: type II toxin-antitoxin system RelB/DinJ family antitoxin [Spirochaetes bacterium]|nr:type II toxin-antitoxin system RelB/DinJ family antitoxin [Spirochaetota bacterium]